MLPRTGKKLAISRRALLAGACAAATLVGCQGLPLLKPQLPNIHPEVEARQEEAVRDYEVTRNDAEYAAALASAEHGDLSTCRITLDKVLTRDSKHLPSRLLMADVELARENVAAAEKILRDTLVDHPDHAAVHHALGLLLEASDRRAEANIHLERAAVAEPQNELYQATRPSAANTNASVGKDAAADKTGAVAAAGFNQPANGASSAANKPASGMAAVASAARTPAARQSLLLAERNYEAGDAAGAQTAWHNAIELEPDNPQIPLALSIHLMRNGRAEEAQNVLSNAARRHPSQGSIFRALGALHLQKGERRAAEVALRQALSLDNSDALSYFLLGHVLSGLGQPEEAAVCCKQAHQLDGRYPEAIVAQ